MDTTCLAYMPLFFNYVFGVVFMCSNVNIYVYTFSETALFSHDPAIKDKEYTEYFKLHH